MDVKAARVVYLECLFQSCRERAEYVVFGGQAAKIRPPLAVVLLGCFKQEVHTQHNPVCQRLTTGMLECHTDRLVASS